MTTIVVIRLVGEAEDRFFRNNILDPQISYDELKKHIKRVTDIDPEFQEIEFRGVKLPDVQFPIRDVKFGEELIVKHVDLPTWEKYKECVEAVLKNHAEKLELANEAVRLFERLTESGFFYVYDKFNRFKSDNHAIVVSWTGYEGYADMIRKATKVYFRKIHDERRGNQDSDFICDFEGRDEELGGTGSTFALVQIHGDHSVSKFDVRHHSNAGKRTRTGRQPDFSEFYCYKLLALIGVCRKSHIIPPIESTEPEPTVYLATFWDDGFELLKNLMDENSLSVDIVVQLVMLNVILFITDLDVKNCGRWKGSQNAAIVDLAVEDSFNVHENIKYELLNTCPHFAWMNRCEAVRKQYDDNSWLKIVKVYAEKWDLSNKIELARAELDPTNGILKEIDDDFEERESWGSPLGYLNDYIDDIKKNVENLQTLLNSVV